MTQIADLSKNAQRILALLRSGERMSQDDLAHEMGEWSSTITPAVLHLDALDLVTVAHWEDDEVAVWRITEAGKEVA